MKLLLYSVYFLSTFISAIIADITASASDFVGMDLDVAPVNPNAVEAALPYCSQYSWNKDKKYYFDKSLLKELSANQYLLQDFNENIQQEGAKVDYYTRFIHIAKGLCYYDDERAYKSLTDFPIFYNNGERIDLRYVKTVNCYYMYNKYLAKGIENNEIPKLPCGIDFATYYNSVYYFIQNSTLCPYPQNNNMISLGDNKTIDKARYAYLLELLDLYKTVEQNEDCYDDYNEEVVNCGYASHLLKTSYCNTHFNEACCKYKNHIQNRIQIKYDFSMGAIIPGIAIAAVYLVIGMLFSIKPIKSIKAKKHIEKAMAKQEQMYQIRNEEHHGGGPASDSNSYFSNPSQIQSHSNLNLPNRYSQILPNSGVDISNYNSSNYLLGSNNNVGPSSVVSLNVNPKASSLYSRSSVDLGSDYSLPVDLSSYNVSERPSSIIERPNRNFQLERPLTPNQRYPPSPNVQRPTTPNINRTNSPNLHPSSSTPNLQRLNQGPPNLQPLPPNINISPMPSPSPNLNVPSVSPATPIRQSVPPPPPNANRPYMPPPPNVNRPSMQPPSPSFNLPSPNVNRSSMQPPSPSFNLPSPNVNHPSAPSPSTSNINRQSIPAPPPNFNLPSPNLNQQPAPAPPSIINLSSPNVNRPSIPPSIPSPSPNINRQSIQAPPSLNIQTIPPSSPSSVASRPVSFIERPPRTPELEISSVLPPDPNRYKQ